MIDTAKAAPMREDVTQAAQRIVRDFRPEGWPAKEDEIARLLDRTFPAHPDAGDEDVERVESAKFWLIVRKPGMVPDRKVPFQVTDRAKILREFMAANPDAFIDYLTVTPDGEPYVDHSPEVLQMADGRSMSVGRKHNERVKTAALAAMREGVDRGMVERLRAAIEQALKCTPSIRVLFDEPDEDLGIKFVVQYDCGNPRHILRAALDTEQPR